MFNDFGYKQFTCGVVIALTLGLAGCQVGTDYVKPTVSTPKHWHAEDDVHKTKHKASEAQVRPWDRFKDPQLTAFIHEAVLHNKSLQRAAERVKQYEALLGIAQSDLYPQVDLVAKGEILQSAKEDSATQNIQHSSQWHLDGGINVSYEIDLWRRVRSQEESALALLLAEHASKKTILLAVETAVAQRYLTLRALDAALILAKESAALSAKQLHLAQQRLYRGFTSALEAEDAKTEFEAAKQEVADLKRQIAIEEHALCVLLGRNPGTIKRGKPIQHIYLPQVAQGVLPSQVLKHRPDIEQAEQMLRSKHADVNVAEAAFFPRIDLLAFLGGQSMESGALFGQTALIGGLGAGLTAPLFQGGRIRSQLNAAKAEHREALIAYLETVQAAFQETEDALVGSHKKILTYQYQCSIQRAQERAFNLQRSRFQEGLTSSFDLFEAKKTLLQIQQQSLQLRLQAFLEQLKLYKALGGTWTQKPKPHNLKKKTVPKAKPAAKNESAVTQHKTAHKSHHVAG